MTLSTQFWQGENALLTEEMVEIAMLVLLAGAEGGIDSLPVHLRVLTNWNQLNEAVMWYLNHQYLIQDIPVITEATRRQVAPIIDRWIRSGEHLDTLKTQLEPLFGPVRASRIATTEVTRLYADGNLLAWQASGLVGAKMWMTAQDERVCPICGPLAGTIVEIDGDWSFSPSTLANNPQLAKALQSLGTPTLNRPPAHVNCRCYLQPVVLDALSDEELANIGSGVML